MRHLLFTILIGACCFGSLAGGEPRWITKRVVVCFPPGPADDREHVGASHNVFVGKVLRKQGVHLASRNIPHTRFEVQVVENIKGDISGKVFVDQLGGVKRRMVFQAVSAEAPGGELSVGSTYCFLTRSSLENAKKNIHRLSSHANGHVIISTNVALIGSKLHEEVHNHPTVVKLHDAYRNEVIPKHAESPARNQYAPKDKN